MCRDYSILVSLEYLGANYGCEYSRGYKSVLAFSEALLGGRLRGELPRFTNSIIIPLFGGPLPLTLRS